MVELHGHGGRVVSDGCLRRVCARRALCRGRRVHAARFLNDKLDLLQAEAVADLVGSGSQLAARAALRSLDGEFSQASRGFKTSSRAARSRRSMARLSGRGAAFRRGARCAAEIDALLASLAALASARTARGAAARRLAIVIAGPPNAGKSSLLNRLAGYEAAIVTDIPGTTRDPLREHLVLDGLPISIVDTAGLRESRGSRSSGKVCAARGRSARADRVLWVVDVREPLDRRSRRRGRAAAATQRSRWSATKSISPARAAAVAELGHLVVYAVRANRRRPRAAQGALRTRGRGDEATGTFSARRRHLAALARTRGISAQRAQSSTARSSLRPRSCAARKRRSPSSRASSRATTCSARSSRPSASESSDGA